MSRSLQSARAAIRLARHASLSRPFHSSRIAQEHYMFPDTTTFTRVVTESKRPVLVQFTATWCQPCRILGPVLQRLTGPDGDTDLVVIDVDKNPDLAGEYRVSAVPFVVGFKNGKVVDKFIGMQPEAKIKEFMAKLK